MDYTPQWCFCTQALLTGRRSTQVDPITEMPTTIRHSQTPHDPTRSWLVFVSASLATLFLTMGFSEHASGQFLLCTFSIAILSVAFVIFYRPDKTLEPAKIFTLLYAASFAYAPIWLLDKRILTTTYFGNSYQETMDRTAVISLVSYICFLLGYLLFSKNRFSPFTNLKINLPQSSEALKLAVIASLAATSFYLLLIAKAGGIGALLGYSGGRADLLSGVWGGLFWGIHIFFAAYGFFLIARIKQNPWLCLFIGVIIAVLFVPFHGRDLIVAPIICWMFAFHTLRKNISWKMVLLGTTAVIAISGLVAAFRSGGNLLAMRDPVAFFTEFFESFSLYFSGVVETNIEQFDSAMIAVRFVEKERVVLGPMVLLNWLGPIDRTIFGGTIPTIYSGTFLDLLVTPEHKGWNTALSPSIVGELWLGLGWPGICGGMFAIGLAFSMLSRWADNWQKQPLIFAAYPFTVYMVTKLIVDGTTHLFRPLLVFCVVWLLWRLFSGERTIISVARQNTV